MKNINKMNLQELESLQDRLHEKENCVRLFIYTSKLIYAKTNLS